MKLTRITLKLQGNIVVYEVHEGKNFMNRIVRLGPTEIGTIYECVTSDSNAQLFVVARMLHLAMGGDIAHWCTLCGCRLFTEEDGIWK